VGVRPNEGSSVLYEWDYGECSFRHKGSGQGARIGWTPIDIGTFVWYKASIWSGAKVLILRMLLGLSDNPPLGTIFNTTQDNREYLPALRKM
jgi:hypothetical protein